MDFEVYPRRLDRQPDDTRSSAARTGYPYSTQLGDNGTVLTR
jgi:hypothetical protein